jgi:hypothetical protein
MESWVDYYCLKQGKNNGKPQQRINCKRQLPVFEAAVNREYGYVQAERRNKRHAVKQIPHAIGFPDIRESRGVCAAVMKHIKRQRKCRQREYRG